MSRKIKGMIGALIAGSMIMSSTAVVASTVPVAPQASPWAVLSVMSGGASAAAVCGAAAVAAAAQGSAAGCVLPALDAPPPVASSAPPPPIPVPPVEATSAGLGISPLLLGLAAIAAGLGLYLALHHRNHSNSPA